jgi:hypothetical protein
MSITEIETIDATLHEVRLGERPLSRAMYRQLDQVAGPARIEPIGRVTPLVTLA